MENKGFMRNTRQREVILEELARAKDHPTAAELHERVRAHLPRISLGTVYRNLDRLTQLGVVRRLELSGQEARFDADRTAHQHVRCSRCGRVDDLGGVSLEALDEMQGDLAGYRIDGYRLEFHGVCPSCRNCP